MNAEASITVTTTASYCPFDLDDRPARFGLRPSRVDTRFGDMHVVATPRPTQSTVTLFLHGFGGHWASWTPLLQQAEADCRSLGDVMLVDLPGFGDSVNQTGHLDAELIGAELLRLVVSAGWSSVRLVGHSMGGFLALDMASRRAGTVIAVDCVSGAYFSIVDAVQAPLRSLTNGARGAAATYLSLSGLARLGPTATPLLWALRRTGVMSTLLKSTVAHPELLTPRVRADLVGAVRPKAFRMAAENGRAYDAADRWSRIEVPVRAMFGERDQLVPPSDGQRLRACLPDATVAVLRGTGHFGPVERPGAVLDFMFPP